LMRFIKEYSLADTADKDHTHTTADITDLQPLLDGKASTDHTHTEYAPTEHTHEMSNINGLTTELDNLKSSGVDAKTAISAAINSKGGTTTSTDTFDAMAQAIAGLSSGGSGGNIKILPLAHDFENITDFKVVGLDFAPDEFFIIGNAFSSQSPEWLGSSINNIMSTIFTGNASVGMNTWI